MAIGFFEKIKAGLEKTKASMMSKVEQIFHGFVKVDEAFFEELEEILILSDVGAITAETVCDNLRKRVKEKGLKEAEPIRNELKDILIEMLGEDISLDFSDSEPGKPAIILVIGVNGAGKTTTIGKLSAQLKNDGKKVIVAAADTFRAAAIEQLEVWTNRAGVELVKHAEGSDPAAVVYDGLSAAKARKADVLICDTAGRLHNKKHLMDELSKISRIITNNSDGLVQEVLLVLDATTGQNAVNQAKLFQDAAGLTGIVLTKLDGTAKGGIVLSIANELKLPVKLVGVGEKLEDLQPFSGRDFVEALFEKSQTGK